MKLTHLLLTASILAVIGFVLYSSRYIFFFRYQPEYYENWYYHSQWNYPGSTRGISDGELYKFVGYRLVEGENPFNIQYETPPFGKYLYGLSSWHLGNPLWISIFLYLASFLVFYFFSREFFTHPTHRLLATLLFATTPFVATQVKETMLDLPLMFLYLLHVWLFVKYLKNNQLKYLISSGVFLGLATGTKPGIYTPFAALFGLILIFFSSKNIRHLLFYLPSLFAGYVLAFFCYFQRHPNPIPWLRLHQKSLSFFLSSQNQVDYLNQWKGIFLNTYQGWWQADKITMGDWSPLLPLGVIATLVLLVWSIRNRHLPWAYLAGLSWIFLLVNSFVPFWPRYLMPVIPLFALAISRTFHKARYLIITLAILNLPFLSTSFATNKPTGDAQAAAHFISTRAYRELYRSLPLEQRQSLPESQFIDLCENFFQQIGTRTTKAQVDLIEQTPTTASFEFLLSYQTSYGSLLHVPVFNFQKIRNQWKLNWQWDYLWPGYGPDSQIVIQTDHLPLSAIQDSQGQIIARTAPWHSVHVIPRLMFDWSRHLHDLSAVTNQSTAEVDRWVRSSIPDQHPRFVGYLDPLLGSKGVDAALAIPGVSLQAINFPVYTSSFLSKNPQSQAIKQLLQQSPDLFITPAQGHVVDSQGQQFPLTFPQSEKTNVVHVLKKPSRPSP
jgi:hypothetical protein